MYIDVLDKEKRKELLHLLEKKKYKYKSFKRNSVIESNLPIHIYIETKEIGMIGNPSYAKIAKIKYTDYDVAIKIINKLTSN